MSPATDRCSKIRNIVIIRQMLNRWRKKARTRSDVPAGHVAIYVGACCRRFIVRATYLNHPIFKNLLLQTAEEYGFANQGPLTIPCEEALFEEILRVVSRPDSGRFPSLEDYQRCCHVDMRKINLNLLGESRPLLHAADESVR